jgi:hypothetical protein
MKILKKIVPVLALFAGVGSLRADTPFNVGTPVNTKATELQLRADQIRQQIKGDERYVMYLQVQARKMKDVIKLNCVNDKLVQIKAEMNISDSANELLQVSLTSNPSERVAAFDELRLAGQSIRDLRQQAAACLGENELVKQESGGTYSAPNFIDDPTIIPFEVYTEPPAYASPFN